jgi:hypothetical protein
VLYGSQFATTILLFISLPFTLTPQSFIKKIQFTLLSSKVNCSTGLFTIIFTPLLIAFFAKYFDTVPVPPY